MRSRRQLESSSTYPGAQSATLVKYTKRGKLMRSRICLYTLGEPFPCPLYNQLTSCHGQWMCLCLPFRSMCVANSSSCTSPCTAPVLHPAPVRTGPHPIAKQRPTEPPDDQSKPLSVLYHCGTFSMCMSMDCNEFMCDRIAYSLQPEWWTKFFFV